MFGDDYVRKIGHATEVEAKSALYYVLCRQYAKDKGLSEDILSDNAKLAEAIDDDTAKLAAAVTNKVFGERGTEEADPHFATEKAELIVSDAQSFASNDELSACLSGAAYNTCYARYIDAGGSRGIFSNDFLVLLCHKRRTAQQNGQQGSCLSRDLASRIRSVAMEYGLCRSARMRRAAGLEVGRNFLGA